MRDNLALWNTWKITPFQTYHFPEEDRKEREGSLGTLGEEKVGGREKKNALLNSKELSKINISYFGLKHYSQTDFTLSIEAEKDPKHGNQLTIYILKSNSGA